MVALVGVVPRYMCPKGWYVGEFLVTDHAGGYIVIELLELFLYVTEEGVARPPSYHNDSIDGYPVEVLGHGGA